MDFFSLLFALGEKVTIMSKSVQYAVHVDIPVTGVWNGMAGGEEEDGDEVELNSSLPKIETIWAPIIEGLTIGGSPAGLTDQDM